MSIGGAILELLFPTKCAFCHRLTEGREQRVCPRCIKSLPYARGAAAEQKLPHIVQMSAEAFRANASLKASP